jgi:predicted flap endonuclease-1-like 5' DNA nuclease
MRSNHANQIMKKAYLFVALFAIWCLASALWYMFSVKGLSTSTQQIDPSDSVLAIAEILIMTLVTVLIGFAIAWFMREDKLVRKQKNINALLADRAVLLSEIQKLNERAKKAEHTLEKARATFHDDYLQVSRERDRLREHLLEEVKDKEALRAELKNTQHRLKEEQQREEMLLNQLEEQRQEASRKDKENAGVRYFINPFQIAATLESADIDDLKKIKGIGPVIERKLNMLGIVSFRQISELNKEAIEQISHTLKFFPDRIERDRWVDQAREQIKNNHAK